MEMSEKFLRNVELNVIKAKRESNEFSVKTIFFEKKEMFLMTVFKINLVEDSAFFTKLILHI